MAATKRRCDLEGAFKEHFHVSAKRSSISQMILLVSFVDAKMLAENMPWHKIRSNMELEWGFGFLPWEALGEVEGDSSFACGNRSLDGLHGSPKVTELRRRRIKRQTSMHLILQFLALTLWWIHQNMASDVQHLKHKLNEVPVPQRFSALYWQSSLLTDVFSVPCYFPGWLNLFPQTLPLHLCKLWWKKTEEKKNN